MQHVLQHTVSIMFMLHAQGPSIHL